jgi:hypothetical protein
MPEQSLTLVVYHCPFLLRPSLDRALALKHLRLATCYLLPLPNFLIASFSL